MQIIGRFLAFPLSLHLLPGPWRQAATVTQSGNDSLTIFVIARADLVLLLLKHKSFSIKVTPIAVKNFQKR